MTAQDTLEKFGATFLRLFRVGYSDLTQTARYMSGNTPESRNETGITSKGMVSDPTPSIAGDTRRIALSNAVSDAEREMALAVQVMSAAADRLEALLAQEGDAQTQSGAPEN